MTKLKTMKLTDLILDFDLYPRNDVSATHVTALVDASEAGEVIPPMVADAKSKRVTDGFHRYRMHERLGHETAEVELRDYATEAEMFADAVRLNASHGRSFDPFDRRRAVLKLADYGYTPEQIKAIVHMPASKLEGVARITATVPGGGVVVVKGGLRAELSGTRMNAAKRDLNESWSGMNPAYHARQLGDLLRAGVVPESPTFVAAMDELVGLWAAVSAKVRKAS